MNNTALKKIGEREVWMYVVPVSPEIKDKL